MADDIDIVERLRRDWFRPSRSVQDEAADEIERLRAEVNDLRNTHRAIYNLAWRVSEQYPSHMNAWNDIRQMTSVAWQVDRRG